MMKLFKHPTATIAGAAALYLSSFVASAAIITIDSIGADWTNVVGGTSLNYTNSDGIAGNEELRWGSPAGASQSGYRFDVAAPPSFSVNTGEEFSLGDFTHFNFPLFGGAISGAQLDITIDLQISGSPLTEGPFTFSFLHNETPNSCSPQPGCANDLVSFSNLVTSDTFMVGGDVFTLELLGFQEGGVTTSSFSTVEGLANVAQLQAIFRTPTTTVPEPGSIALLALGLLAMGTMRKRT